MSEQSTTDWRDEWGAEACRCTHFNGLQNDTCEAGHCYEDLARELTEEELQHAVEKEERYHSCGGAWAEHASVDLERYALMQRIPCKRETGVGGCPDYELPSREELERRKEERDRAIAETMAARGAIEEELEKRGLAGTKANVSGSIDCPICEATGREGRLKYRRSGHNGHVRARCTTDGCVHFME